MLQRLKCERGVIKNALSNLPKTLYETYERIFLMIPDEDRLFVHFVFEWIQRHEELTKGNGMFSQNIPCATLLLGVEKSLARLSGSQNGRFYDENTLWELCGCLINITVERPTNSSGRVHASTHFVSLAHYTVLEYLESTRILKDSLTYSTSYIETVFSEALRIQSIDLLTSNIKLHSLRRPAFHNFRFYCVLSSFSVLNLLPEQISTQDRLFTLAIDFVNPEKPHYKILSAKAFHSLMSKSSPGWSQQEVYRPKRWYLGSWPWDLSPKETEATHFLRILVLENLRGECLVLSEQFLQGKECKNFLEVQLRFKIPLSETDWGSPRGDYLFFGSIMEISVLLSSRAFNLLLDYGTGHFDPSEIIPLLIVSLCNYVGYQGFLLLKRLLELGPDLDKNEYMFTALQMAVGSQEVNGVRSLLEAGADPNNAGNENGIWWHGWSTLMARFGFLQHASPLYICRNHNRTLKNSLFRIEIETLLLQYGAREFVLGDKIVELDNIKVSHDLSLSTHYPFPQVRLQPV